MTDMIHWHKHHLVPLHAGGADDPSNIVRVNPVMHAMLHKIRWEETGDKYDKLAWQGLTKMIGHDEAIIEVLREVGRRHFENGTALYERTSEKHSIDSRKGGQTVYENNAGIYGMTAEARFDANSRGGKIGGKRGACVQRTTCPHCGKEGQLAAMSRCHFDKCNKKPQGVTD